jgi:hypothetical protein
VGTLYYWGHGKLGRCVIQLSKFLNHTLATHNQVFENINYNDGKGTFTLTLFEMTTTDCPGFHVPHCIVCSTKNSLAASHDNSEVCLSTRCEMNY